MVATTAPLKTYDDLAGPPGLPVVGNFHQLRLARLHLTLERWADRYGPLYRLRIGRQRLAVVSDPGTLQRLHRDRPARFRRPRNLERVATEMHLNGVFVAEGGEWLRQRKLVVMALNTAHLKLFFPKMTITIARLERRWERAADAGEPVDLCRELMRFTVDVVAQLAFGIDFNTVETDGPVIQRNLDKVFPMLHRRQHSPFPYWRYFRLPKDRELDRALDELRGQVEEIIEEVRERVRADPAIRATPSNFLEAIIAAREVKGMAVSNDDIFTNVCTLLLAGEDTTANTIAWTAYYFMRYPEHFARARAEVDGVLGPAASAVEVLDQVNRFPFLDACYNEAMRLKPVAPLNAFEPLEDVELLGHLIPKGTSILSLNRYGALRDEHFGQAARFDPDRWLAKDPRAGDDRRGERPHDESAFMPFGAGPRFCPGRNLALLQLRTVLAMLCRNFEVELADPARPVEEKAAFTMMPTNLFVRLKRRATPSPRQPE